MKKIIEGKLYKTKTATLIVEYNNGFPSDNFYYYKESLYQKKTGEYFIAYGGAFIKQIWGISGQK